MKRLIYLEILILSFIIFSRIYCSISLTKTKYSSNNNVKDCVDDYIKELGDKKSNSKHQVQGHYEKVQKTVIKYFYVDSDKPSGLPGAYVVPESETRDKIEQIL